MSISNKKFIIRHQDIYGEKKFEIVSGKLLVAEKENIEKRKYIYRDKSGNCEILLQNQIITITKNENILKISFDKKKNFCLYKIENYEFEFFILGKEYTYDEILKIFAVKYEIFDKNNLKLNEINFSIREF